MAKMMKKSSMKKYMTGGVANPNASQFMTAKGVVSKAPGSKGSGGANMGSVMTSKSVAGKGTTSRAKSSGGVNTPPSGKGNMPGKKMGGSTKMKSKSKSKSK